MKQPPKSAPTPTGWRQDLYIIIFESNTKWGKRFDLLLLWAIILSVIAVLFESDQNISLQYGDLLHKVEWIFTVIFSLEYLARIICTRRPARYMKSFFGLVDFISIAPAYLSMFFPGTQFLMVIRAVRLLRVFRVLKLARYLKESQVLLGALRSSRIKITIFLGAVLTIVLIMGTFMHILEANTPGFSSIFEGMYWAVVTMTTVGYGDAVPITSLGKFAASFLMIMGYGIIAVPTGIVSSELAIAQVNHDSTADLCPKCQAPLPNPAANFCAHCGASLKTDS